MSPGSPHPAETPAPDRAKDFYEARYAAGYMETWPDWKRARVRGIVAELPLPASGEALDFGCGNGVFTQALREALPGWNVHGTDLAETALANARERVPEASFFRMGEARPSAPRFDLVFTHHVLEHVLDLDAALTVIDGFLKPGAAVLHILPCGNPGSFEHEVCGLRSDGIDAAREGRFFFEDEGHVRRLDTGRLVDAYARRGYRLGREFYAGQRAGAIHWITAAGPAFVATFADPSHARDARAAARLRALGRRLGALARLRRIKREVEGRWARGRLRPWTLLRMAAVLPLYLAGRVADRRIVAASEREWAERRGEPNGSEMYLFFVPDGGPRT